MMNKDDALKMALETLENVPIEYDFHGKPMDAEFNEQLESTLQALRQALEEPEQEPYCWVQSKLTQGMFYKEKPRKIRTIPLYTSPPKREWVGLTDDEIKEIVGPWGDIPIKGYTRKLFDQIEAKLKEKNNENDIKQNP